jgi:hypothetical protein
LNYRFISSIGIGLVCLSCLDNTSPPKPKDLVSPGKMSVILSDLLIAKWFSNVQKKTKKSFLTNFSINQFLKSDHRVDSLQLVQSLHYYESHPGLFFKILEQTELVLKERLE